MAIVHALRITPRQHLKAGLERRRHKPDAQVAAALRDDMFPIAVQLIEARSHRERARLLLRVSDGLVLTHFDALKEACDLSGFAEGAGYLAERFVALHAVRDDVGLMPAKHVNQVENWRRGLAAIAGASR